MTTIAYRGGVMAADSLCSFNGRRRQAKKIFLTPLGVVGFAGNFPDALAMLEWLENNRRDDAPNFPQYRGERDAPDVTGLIARADGTVKLISEYLMIEPICEPFFAIGSGADAAMAAMHCDCSAPQAIEIAARVDVHTGAPIQVFDCVQQREVAWP